MLTKGKVINSASAIPEVKSINGMEITLNNKSTEISESALLADIVALQMGDKQKGIAVAVNQKVIPRSEWSATTIQQNDNILIIKATQGG